MAVTMTLHNLPEGFAVAFAAFTDFGPVMALAIAIHNIPEVRKRVLLLGAGQGLAGAKQAVLEGCRCTQGVAAAACSVRAWVIDLLPPRLSLAPACPPTRPTPLNPPHLPPHRA